MNVSGSVSGCGSENANVNTVDNIPHYLDCSTPEGFRGGNFSSTIVLFADHDEYTTLFAGVGTLRRRVGALKQQGFVEVSNYVRHL